MTEEYSTQGMMHDVIKCMFTARWRFSRRKIVPGGVKNEQRACRQDARLALCPTSGTFMARRTPEMDAAASPV